MTDKNTCNENRSVECKNCRKIKPIGDYLKSPKKGGEVKQTKYCKECRDKSLKKYYERKKSKVDNEIMDDSINSFIYIANYFNANLASISDMLKSNKKYTDEMPECRTTFCGMIPELLDSFGLLFIQSQLYSISKNQEQLNKKTIKINKLYNKTSEMKAETKKEDEDEDEDEVEDEDEDEMSLMNGEDSDGDKDSESDFDFFKKETSNECGPSKDCEDSYANESKVIDEIIKNANKPTMLNSTDVKSAIKKKKKKKTKSDD